MQDVQRAGERSSSNPADLTSVVEDLLRSHVSGQVPRVQSGPVERGLGTGVILQGALVFDLYAYSLAAQAGLRPGDVIQSINREEVGNAGEALRLTQNAKDRRTLLRVWSNGGSHFLLVAMGEQP